MATSGSVNYSINRNEIITEALELLGVIAAGDTVSSDDASSCSRTLNLFVKHLQSRGVAFWKSTEIYLPLQDSTASYSIGSSGHATTSLSKTEISTAASSGASSILVDSITSISDGDYIGIELDDGTLQWSTVNGSPSGSTVALDDTLTDDVSVDANVFSYTTKCNRPLFITEARLHEDGGTERPIELVARNEYKRLSLKTTENTPSMAWYDPQLTNGVLYIWPLTSTVKDYIIMTARMPIEDFDAAANDPDFPQEWLLALAYNLAVLVAPKFDEEVSADFRATAGILLQDAMDSAADYGSLYMTIEDD